MEPRLVAFAPRLPHVAGEVVRKELREGTENVQVEATLAGGVVDVLGDRQQANVGYAEPADRLQCNAEIARPAIEGVDEDDVERVRSGVVEEMDEAGPAVQAIRVRAQPFIAVDPLQVEAAGLASLLDRALLRGEAVTLDLVSR